jgi:hypothetical protein
VFVSQDHATEEPYDAKVSRTVLQPGGSGDRPAEVNPHVPVAQQAGTDCPRVDPAHTGCASTAANRRRLSNVN